MSRLTLIMGAAPILARAASSAGLSISAASIDPTVGGGAPKKVRSGGSCRDLTGGRFSPACCLAAAAAAGSWSE